jgi:enoyl-[acyl-carrier protein] reductase II
MRVIANAYTSHFEEHRDELQRFPDQLRRSMADGAWHLGGDDTTTGIDPGKEGYPSGQGVGAIDALVPAGDLVVRFVEEAEAVLNSL